MRGSFNPLAPISSAYVRIYLQVAKTVRQPYQNLAQRMLKGKFPKINRLHLTLLQDKPHKEPTDNAISLLQIFYIGRDHWIYATTIGTSGKRVLVYDSRY